LTTNKTFKGNVRAPAPGRVLVAEAWLQGHSIAHRMWPRPHRELFRLATGAHPLPFALLVGKPRVVLRAQREPSSCFIRGVAHSNAAEPLLVRSRLKLHPPLELSVAIPCMLLGSILALLPGLHFHRLSDRDFNVTLRLHITQVYVNSEGRTQGPGPCRKQQEKANFVTSLGTSFREERKIPEWRFQTFAWTHVRVFKR